MARIKYWDEESQTWKYADKSLGPNIDLTEYAKKEDIPEKLPNPNALTITGAVNATYDGSGETTIEIPVNESFGQYGLGETANIVRIPSDYALIDFKKSGWYTVQLDYGTVDFGDGYTANKFLLRVETGECEQYNTVTKQTVMFSSYPGGEEYVRYCKNGDNWTAWKKVIHHPQTLTFTGAVNATYDGSEAVEVEIPQGGGGGSTEWNTICEGKIAEAVSAIVIDSSADGTPLEALDVNELLIYGAVKLSANSKIRFENNGRWVSGTYATTAGQFGAWVAPFCIRQQKTKNGIVTEISIESEHKVLCSSNGSDSYPIKSFEVHVETADVTFTTDKTVVNAYYR